LQVQRGFHAAAVTAAIVAGGFAATAPAAGAASFDCEASALRGSVLGHSPVEPVVANRGAGVCRTATAGGELPLPAPLSAVAVFARTTADRSQAAGASGGLGNVRVRALPDLAIPLPIDQLANNVSAITVPLPALVTDLIEETGTVVGGLTGGVTGTLDGATGGVIGGVTGGLDDATGGLTGGLTGGDPSSGGSTGGGGDSGDGSLGGGLLGNLPLGDLPVVGDVPVLGGILGGSGGSTSGGGGGLLGGSGGGSGGGGLLGGLRATRRASSAPTAITIDIRPALAALLPNGRLPNVDLLSAEALEASVSGRCVSGRPELTATSRVAGVRVLGQELPVDTAVEQVLRLADSTRLDLSKLDPSLVRLPAGLSFADPVLGPALRDAVRSVLATLPVIQLPEVLARVKLTPGGESRTATALTRQALRVEVAIAGQSVADLTVGEAAVRADGSVCDAAGTVTGSSSTSHGHAHQSVAGASLACSRRKLVLIDVLERGGRVGLEGAADRSLVGRTTTIVFDGGQRVARAKIRRDGTFSTTAPLPPRKVRFTNDARYQAVVGRERSLDLKLHRRLVVSSVKSSKGVVTIAGRVLRPLGKPMQTIAIKRRVTCRHEKIVKRFTPRSDGSFRVTLRAPKALDVAVYRFGTRVRKTTRNPKLFPTFTLPRAVELH
jgi:hypothetical protein